MEFAKQGDFHQPFSQIYFAEDRKIHRFFDPEKIDEISRADIFAFDTYEARFNEILGQGYSWVNLNFAGMLENDLLIIVELPSNRKETEITAVNLSLPGKRVIENNRSLSSFYKII